ncbi:hypothetical protein RU58_00057 [Achromobacter phage phiAxp-1]|uniref:minor tail protein n=1 Tax=Achromobacter phage phiAxp-1 TaxID=1610509 RepID=UPI0006557304|nr:minor tail protein [Achromobacter phage phiAxp-1]AKJ71382.1 hypothetical protein RU58_00057 [Achromobacter phage phiAxp-1]QDH84435.1 putative transcriptional regulator [Achromobacter phage vB_AxyS_19-32_Axy19]WNO48667.1 hypothetical protein [Achromobacter phage nyashin_LB6]
MATSAYSEAIKEAYVMAPADELVYHTLEIRHPTFRDGNNRQTAIRVVQGNDDVMLRVEAGSTGPNPGEVVQWLGCNFSITLPKSSREDAPELNIRLPNVDREMVGYIERANATLDPIIVVYRPYLESNPDEPQMNPPIEMKLAKVKADVFNVTGRATFDDFRNRPFPFNKYTRNVFQRL